MKFIKHKEWQNSLTVSANQLPIVLICCINVYLLFECNFCTNEIIVTVEMFSAN